ncbi:MAG: DUF4229 domain-containing protein [Microbacterium sp.]
MRIRSALVYTVLRLLAFLVPFGILILFFPIFRTQYWLAAVFAALIGLSLSLLFLRRPLDALTTDLAARRGSDTAATDEEVEDSAELPTAPDPAPAADPEDPPRTTA